MNLTTGLTRKVRCRYLRRGTSGQCTAEAAGGDYSEILLCTHHLAAAMEMVNRQARAA